MQLKAWQVVEISETGGYERGDEVTREYIPGDVFVRKADALAQLRSRKKALLSMSKFSNSICGRNDEGGCIYYIFADYGYDVELRLVPVVVHVQDAKP